MKAYDELRARRKVSARKAKSLGYNLQDNWELIENNYGQLIFDEVERQLLPAGSLSNRFLRLILGKSQQSNKEIAAAHGVRKSKVSQNTTAPLLNQALNFAKPLLLTFALGLVKRKIRTKVRGRR